jgi:hypothetical protein
MTNKIPNGCDRHCNTTDLHDSTVVPNNYIKSQLNNTRCISTESQELYIYLIQKWYNIDEIWGILFYKFSRHATSRTCRLDTLLRGSNSGIKFRDQIRDQIPPLLVFAKGTNIFNRRGSLFLSNIYYYAFPFKRVVSLYVDKDFPSFT